MEFVVRPDDVAGDLRERDGAMRGCRRACCLVEARRDDVDRAPIGPAARAAGGVYQRVQREAGSREVNARPANRPR